MHYIGCFKTTGTPWTILMLGKVVTQFAVPIFFMVSGATIFSSSREEPYASFIKRRITKIAIPFVVYSVIYYLFYVYVKKEYALGVGEFLKRFLNKDIQGHFWYLYALIPLYFFYPAIKKCVNSLSQKGLLSLILAFFAIDSLIPLVNQVLALFCDYKIGLYSFGRMGVYLNYTLIGYYIHTYVKANKKNGFIATFTGLFSVSAMALLTYFTSDKKINQEWIDILLAFVVIQSVSVMILTKCIYEKKHFRPFMQKTLSTLGMLSFSAYLVHMLVLRWIQIEISQSYMKSIPSSEGALWILGIFVFAVIVCYLWSFIVSKIPFIKKIL
jgi:surface polysaccharide O-acyltransferase-like enzyme